MNTDTIPAAESAVHDEKQDLWAQLKDDFLVGDVKQLATKIRAGLLAERNGPVPECVIPFIGVALFGRSMFEKDGPADQVWPVFDEVTAEINRQIAADSK